MMKKRTETIIETHQVQIVRRRKRAARAWCEACAAAVRMVTSEEAATLAGVTQRTIYRRVEAGELHFVETPEGALLICSNSITG
jgi:excisionase family DNA binding protein